jgi:bile acid:Na+ symporter, BASS family
MKAMIEEVFRVLLGVIIPLASFDTGLAARASGLAARASGRKRLWRRPAAFAWALLAVLVAVPLWVLVLAKLAPLPNAVRGGLLIATLAVGIGPVAGLKRMTGLGPASSEALDLNLAVLVLSMLYVPVAFTLVAVLFRVDVHLGIKPVAEVVLGRSLVPMLLGLGVARFLPRFADEAAPVLAKIVNAAIVGIFLIAIVALWKDLARVGSAGWLAAAAAALGAIVIGHLLGGPDPVTRGVVAVASVMRFPALALTLSSALPEGRRFIPEVIVYVLVATLAMTAYGLVLGHKARRRPRLVVSSRAAPRTA